MLPDEYTQQRRVGDLERGFRELTASVAKSLRPPVQRITELTEQVVVTTETANQGVSDAATADGKAVTAQTAAATAQTKANSASTDAATADAKAVAAQTDADSAASAASTADGKAVTAQGQADTATTNAAAANSAASAAQTKANSATTAAATADSKAVTAQNAASSAASAASTADGKAVSAQSAATSAASAASTADAKAVSASGLAATKAVVLYQTATPGSAYANTNTLWIDITNGANTPKKWTTGTTWVAVTDSVATAAASSAATANSAAATAQMQANTATSNAASANSAASSAQGTANTAVTNAATAKSAADTAQGQANTATTNAASANTAAGTAQSTADTAKTNAATAQSRADAAFNNAASAATTAGNAQTTANEKNTVWYQASAPSGTGHAVDDIWFDTDNGNAIARWSISVNDWVPAQLGTNAIANLAITNALIANLDGGKITADTVTAIQLIGTAIDGMTVTGALIRTAASGRRVQLDTTGLKGYDDAGVVKTSVGTDGLLTAVDAIITGTMRTGTSGQRAEVSGSSVKFYSPSGYANSIYSVNADTATGFLILEAGGNSIQIGRNYLPSGGQADISVPTLLATKIYTDNIFNIAGGRIGDVQYFTGNPTAYDNTVTYGQQNTNADSPQTNLGGFDTVAGSMQLRIATPGTYMLTYSVKLGAGVTSRSFAQIGNDGGVQTARSSFDGGEDFVSVSTTWTTTQADTRVPLFFYKSNGAATGNTVRTSITRLR